jgi:hypothetical protein
VPLPVRYRFDAAGLHRADPVGRNLRDFWNRRDFWEFRDFRTAAGLRCGARH